MADAQRLLNWFEKLASRTLDLVGDYAGDELFLLEGDSLLLQCLSDKTLDFSHGLQLLHATHLVGKFLAQLHKRKCVFHLVFFSEHSRISIPPAAAENLWPKYRFAREAIVQHLTQNLPAAVPSIQIRRFASYRCRDFGQYLASVGAYFLMCHDGTFVLKGSVPQDTDSLNGDDATVLSDDGESSSSNSEGNHDNAPSSIEPTKLMLRSMIHWFVLHGYNISILNSLEYRDSKVLSMVLEGSVSRARELYDYGTLASVSLDGPPPIPNTIPLYKQKVHYGAKEEQLLNKALAMIEEEKLGLTQREWATVVTVGMMHRSTPSGLDGLLEACAMLLHTVILSECKLSERATVSTGNDTGERYLENFSNAMKKVLTSEPWKQIIEYTAGGCDLGDAVDGRLFLETLRVLRQTKSLASFSLAIRKRSDVLIRAVSTLFEINVHLGIELGHNGTGETSSDALNARSLGSRKKPKNKAREQPNNIESISVLPFSNRVIDVHLRPVSVEIADFADGAKSSSCSRIFKELSHWHNHRRLLNERFSASLTERQKVFINRRNQFFMTDVLRYAASLTNAIGGSLEPESVFVRPQNDKTKDKNNSKSTLSHNGDKRAVAPKPDSRLSSTNHKKHGQHGRPSVRDQIAEQWRLKQRETVDKHFAAWRLKLADLERERDYSARYIRAKQYLSNLSTEKRTAVEVEVLAFMTGTLLLVWKEQCNNGGGVTSMHIVALIWHTVQQIAKSKHGLTEGIAKCMQATTRLLNLPALRMSCGENRSLSFKFPVLDVKMGNVSIGISSTEFQLIHAGPYMDRSMGSAADPRVHDFEPDAWQREVLDEIDARRSLFVVAPTSAGKTFISFYAIKQILEDDNDGVLVYVAPTKALVNQIAAEIQARFSKSFDNTLGKSVWAIHTRDYRINNPTGCQVLITVPHILQIMLLAPTNAKTWSPRIKRIIFDEVHCIGQAEDGVIWEQLLLLASCPIIALSATVGNPKEFKKWLGMAQKANGLELRMIQHKTRYSDLRKYIYNPPAKFAFNGLSTPLRHSVLGLEGSANMAFLHPVASLIDRSRGLPDDLTLEPRDCFTLWMAMKRFATDNFPIDENLDPSVALPNIIKKADVIGWEAQLKAVLKDWMSCDSSPFESVVQHLAENLGIAAPDIQGSGEHHSSLEPATVDGSSILDTTLPLICSLHDQNALPALFFNYDRAKCEQICEHLVSQLKESEDRWKESSLTWRRKLAKFDEWRKMQEKQAKVKETNNKKGKKNEDDEEDGKMSLARENAEYSPFETFNPDEPVAGFHFADEKKLTNSEFEEYATEMRKREVPEHLIIALKRGIGVHHAGLIRKYRQVCEVLFRKGYLRVVIATGTLALGVNMPCKTVVFSGDSVYLTALNFRQAAGRAGRRGFDFLGNVVFQGLPHQKVCRLLSSRLPDLNGHFPLTTSLVLRLMILLHESKQAPYAVKAVNSILSCPRIYLGGPESKQTVLHHLRFSIEYLRRNWLLDTVGAPLNFAGMVSHLYYTENSSFAFHALLSEGYFHRLCNDINEKPTDTIRTLMLVMSHLFGRQFLRPSALESLGASRKSTSVVILPELPEQAAKILHSHNKRTLGTYSAYVKTFIEQHLHADDCTLPLTGLKCGGDESASTVTGSMRFLAPTRINSAFVALSGHQDEWESISDLCQMVRGGVWLEESVIPHVQASPKDGQAPLNAYLYDFFKHGNVHALVTENMIRKGDLWFVLNDFSLVLATIVTTLENFMKLSPGTDPEMLETMGVGDAFDEELEDKAFEGADFQTKTPEPQLTRGRPSISTSAILPAKAKAKKKPVADSWEDEVSEDDLSDWEKEDSTSESQGNTSRTPQSSDPSSRQGSPDAVLEDKGFLQVLQGFRMLQAEFNEKFKAMWA
ncbi:putative DEAD/DEAH box helicase [Aspergillus undulatus]|uniref:putative DEAD/DEAH box helicase n=1 Tax=Aspergillus undulatus TaxID=1810928 RepID=UPI003CCD7A67